MQWQEIGWEMHEWGDGGKFSNSGSSLQVEPVGSIDRLWMAEDDHKRLLFLFWATRRIGVISWDREYWVRSEFGGVGYFIFNFQHVKLDVWLALEWKIKKMSEPVKIRIGGDMQKDGVGSTHVKCGSEWVHPRNWKRSGQRPEHRGPLAFRGT